ncbi:MAG: glycosyltransferase family 2 protein [Flavobacterium sp.]
MIENSNPLVSISCITYNHAPFIRECLDGFLMQKTSFSFEIVIHDDCSTDGTREIIEEYAVKYPNIFFPVFQEENQYSKGVRGMMVKYNFPRCRGKYIATCEADDYWTDPYKLQKQVDFLERNANYAGCSHKTNVINNKNDEWEESDFWQGHDEDKDLDLKDMVSIVVPFHTSSYLFRSSVIPQLSAFYKKWNLAISGDIVLFTLSCKLGPVKFLKDEMSSYRVHYGGVTSSKANSHHFRGLFDRYIMWVLLSKQFTKSEQLQHFDSVIKHYEHYLIKKGKKISISKLLKEVGFFLKSNPVNPSDKIGLTYKLLKNKITKTI